jgi:DNA replication protein DnaC
MLEQTKQQIASLKLNGILEALEEQLREPPHQLSFEDRVALLIDREVLHRDNRRLANRLKQAKLKPGCSFEQIDFRATRGLNKQQFLSLTNMGWVKLHKTVLITGPTGVGKTFIAQALAHKACLQGFTARYFRLLHLMHDAAIAYREGSFQRFLQSIGKQDVLIIDDFGIMVMDAEQKRLLLEILEHRYEQNATIITSQLATDDWYDYINDPLIADALLDRVVHQAEKITLFGESMRKIKAKTVDGENHPSETP